MELNRTAFRARFAELGEQREATLFLSAPLRARRDAIVAEAQSQVDALDRQIADAEIGLSDIDQERALIARALGGRIGE